jgi:hypothetical protein
MKIKLLIVFAFLSMPTVGQLTGKVTGLNITKKTSVNDTVIKVVYNNNKISNNPNPPALFFNGKLVSYSLLSTINPQNITSVNVVKKDTIIDSVKYFGKIMIQGKTPSKYNYMSLSEFKSKYVSSSENVPVFQIDGTIVDDNYDTYLIDEKNILRVIVTPIDNPRQKIKIDFINLLTKSDKNVEESEPIIAK